VSASTLDGSSWAPRPRVRAARVFCSRWIPGAVGLGPESPPGRWLGVLGREGVRPRAGTPSGRWSPIPDPPRAAWLRRQAGRLPTARGWADLRAVGARVRGGRPVLELWAGDRRIEVLADSRPCRVRRHVAAQTGPPLGGRTDDELPRDPDCLWCGTPGARGRDLKPGRSCVRPAWAGHQPFARALASPAARAASEATRSRTPPPSLAPARRPRHPAFPTPGSSAAALRARRDPARPGLRARRRHPLAGLGLPPATRIAEPGAGVGFFAPPAGGSARRPRRRGPDRARERLRAPTGPGAPPRPIRAVPGGEPMDQVVAAFLLGRVRGAGLRRRRAPARPPPGGPGPIELRRDPAGGSTRSCRVVGTTRPGGCRRAGLPGVHVQRPLLFPHSRPGGLPGR
jgi:hypothetical protein